jgi:hypothetical protein
VRFPNVNQREQNAPRAGLRMVRRLPSSALAGLESVLGSITPISVP